MSVATNAKGQRVRVLIIDDSSMMREMLQTVLQSSPDVEVVGTGKNGADAVTLATRLRPDVITMDVQMPGVDGLEATRRIMRTIPTPIIIVTGSLMHSDADLTMEALRAGALTVLRKPGLADPQSYEELINTVRSMAGVPVLHHWGHGRPLPARTHALRINTPRRPGEIQVVGIASSTGGPSVLAGILQQLPRDFPLPVLIVQHITTGFGASLAEWLSRQTYLPVAVASHGDALRPGQILLAPDDYHMQVTARGMVELSHEESYHALRPSANYLFRSLARAYGRRALGIILTGIGDDGCDGLEELHLAGGLTVAQNEATCVVFGMPRAAMARQIVDHALPPDEIATLLMRLAPVLPDKVS